MESLQRMKSPGVIIGWLVLAGALLVLALWALGVLPGGSSARPVSSRTTRPEEIRPEPPEPVLPSLPQPPAEPEVLEPDPENVLR